MAKFCFLAIGVVFLLSSFCLPLKDKDLFTIDSPNLQDPTDNHTYHIHQGNSTQINFLWNTPLSLDYKAINIVINGVKYPESTDATSHAIMANDLSFPDNVPVEWYLEVYDSFFSNRSASRFFKVNVFVTTVTTSTMTTQTTTTTVTTTTVPRNITAGSQSIYSYYFTAANSAPSATFCITLENTSEMLTIPINIYLSTDSTITTSDTLLATNSILMSSPSECKVLTISFPNNLRGKYYMGHIADPDNLFTELDETDNSRAIWALETQSILYALASTYSGDISINHATSCSTRKTALNIYGQSSAAFISTTSFSANEILVDTSLRVAGPNGTVLATNWANLWDGNVDNSLFAAGVLPSASASWWSGTDQYGNGSTDGQNHNCVDWSTTGYLGRAGKANAVDSFWVWDPGDFLCYDTKYLLCVAY